jgi:hypothetical protein
MAVEVLHEDRQTYRYVQFNSRLLKLLKREVNIHAELEGSLTTYCRTQQTTQHGFYSPHFRTGWNFKAPTSHSPFQRRRIAQFFVPHLPIRSLGCWVSLDADVRVQLQVMWYRKYTTYSRWPCHMQFASQLSFWKSNKTEREWVKTGERVGRKF